MTSYPFTALPVPALGPLVWSRQRAWATTLITLGPPIEINPTPPVLQNVSPAALSSLDVSDPISFEISRTAGLKRALVWVEYADLAQTEMVFDGSQFLHNFEQSTFVETYVDSLLTKISFVIRRSGGGWLSRPEIQGAAFGVEGQELV